ncbi:MAG: hypothetical protein M0R51_15135 [Clostridia bacterium]|jgi:hypothetical protein|nr:hypothetical protein [Clostridia bacterium]
MTKKIVVSACNLDGIARMFNKHFYSNSYTVVVKDDKLCIYNGNMGKYFPEYVIEHKRGRFQVYIIDKGEKI